MTINADFKERWVSALRSGNFAQTQNHLKVTLRQAKKRDLPVGYCCLGVGCEVMAGMTSKISVTRQLERETMPTRAVLDYWGLPKRDADHLAEMNDNGASFEKIATYVEMKL